jgi:hypothetical protein
MRPCTSTGKMTKKTNTSPSVADSALIARTMAAAER